MLVVLLLLLLPMSLLFLRYKFPCTSAASDASQVTAAPKA